MDSKALTGAFGVAIFVLICAVTITNALPAPGASDEQESAFALPIPSAQRGGSSSSSSYNSHPNETVSTIAIILILLFLLGCVIGPMVTLLICFCPKIFPCKHIRNRRPGCGNCNWSDMTTYGYLRNRLQQQPVIVTVNMAPQQNPGQYPGQSAPLVQPPVVIQQPPSPRGGGRVQAGFVYAAPGQPAVYTPPSYPVQPQQQPYNPTYPS